MTSKSRCSVLRRLVPLASIFLAVWAGMAVIMSGECGYTGDNTNLSPASLLSPGRVSQDVLGGSGDLSVVELKRNIRQLRELKEKLFREIKENEVVGRMISLKLEHVAEKRETESHVEELERALQTLRALTKKLENLEFMLGSMSIKPDDIQTRGAIRKREYLINNLHRALNSGWRKKFSSVSAILRKYLDLTEVDNYEKYVKIKIKLILKLMDTEKKIQYEINRFHVLL